MRSITFLMPGNSPRPAGGYKVVYEYANRFVADGYDVHIVMPMSLKFCEYSFSRKLQVIPRYLFDLITGRYRPYKWFDLDKRVKIHLTLSLSEWLVSKSDIYIATAIKTSEYLDNYKNVPNTCKFYLIQDYENWGIPDNRVIKSYRFDMNNISISKWLNKIITDAGANSTIIPNGFDFNKFRFSTLIEQRSKYIVSVMYHSSDRKGFIYSYKALDIVKKKYPQLKVVLFGTTKPTEQFPEWYEFHHMPSAELHNDIYNRSAIYISSSLLEGWGLTVGEAMICGAAVACTDIDGFKEMVVDGESALLSPVKDPEAMAENIIRLIEDDELRCRIAKNGNAVIQQYTWETSYCKFRHYKKYCVNRDLSRGSRKAMHRFCFQI